MISEKKDTFQSAQDEVKCCVCIPFKLAMILILIFSLFNNFVWVQTWKMISGQIENDPEDNFADSWGAQNKPFVIILLTLSLLVTALNLNWLVKDSETSRKGAVLANVILFISAVLMVLGGDYMMVIDICLSIWWFLVTKKYYEAKKGYVYI